MVFFQTVLLAMAKIAALGILRESSSAPERVWHVLAVRGVVSILPAGRRSIVMK